MLRTVYIHTLLSSSFCLSAQFFLFIRRPIGLVPENTNLSTRSDCHHSLMRSFTHVRLARSSPAMVPDGKNLRKSSDYNIPEAGRILNAFPGVVSPVDHACALTEDLQYTTCSSSPCGKLFRLFSHKFPPSADRSAFRNGNLPSADPWIGLVVILHGLDFIAPVDGSHPGIGCVTRVLTSQSLPASQAPAHMPSQRYHTGTWTGIFCWNTCPAIGATDIPSARELDHCQKKQALYITSNL